MISANITWSLAGIPLLLIALAVSLPARAAGTAGAPVVYAGPSDDTIATLATQEVTGLLGLTESEVLPAESVAEFVFDGALIWPTSGSPEPCPRGVEELGLESTIQDAEAAIDLVAYEQAVSLLTPIFEQLACVGDPASPTQLSRAAFLLGFVRYQEEDIEEATETFRMAAAFDPDLTWDNNFAPEAQQTFNNAVLDALREETSYLRLNGGIWEMPGLTVDGEAVPERGAVHPGLHRVTVPAGDGSMRCLSVRFPANTTVHLAPADELVPGMVESNEAGEQAVVVLAAALLRQEASEAYVVDTTSHHVYRIVADTGRLIGPLGRSRARVTLAPGSAPNPGAVMVIAGAVVGAVGLTIGLVQRSQAIDAYDQAVANPGSKDAFSDDFYDSKSGMTAGFVVAGIGGLALCAGIPVWISTAKKHQTARRATIGLSWSTLPGEGSEARLWLSGSW